MGVLIVWSLTAFVLTFLVTRSVARVAKRLGMVDVPSEERKIHSRPIPLLGGLGIFLVFAGCIVALLLTGDVLTSGEIGVWQFVGVLLAGVVLMIGGAFDDKYRLPPHVSIIAPVVAAGLAVGFGIEIEKLSMPFGDPLYLLSWQSDLLVFLWLLVVMYTTKLLDGLDGLSAGVSAIGALMIMSLSLLPAYFQPDVALLSAVAFGALLGFLVWNFHPAYIFLGEGGSTFVGFLIGTLAVISGGKVATAMLVLGVPLLDLVWAIARRFRNGGIKRIFAGDRAHLHHRLFDLGWGQRRIVLVYYLAASVFGVTALFLQSREKFVALVVLSVLMILAATLIVMQERRESASSKVL